MNLAGKVSEVVAGERLQAERSCYRKSLASLEVKKSKLQRDLAAR